MERETGPLEFTTLISLHNYSLRNFSDQPLFGTKVGDEWKWMSYREFGRQVSLLKNGMILSGLKAGDTVAIISRNRQEWAVVAYAAFAAGAKFVPMYETQGMNDWRHIIQDCGAKMLFVPDCKIKKIIMSEWNEFPKLKTICELGRNPKRNEASGYETMMANGYCYPCPEHKPDPDELACIIYTSGTTGKPKGVELTHRNIASNVSAVRGLFPIGPSDRCLSFLPWAHAFGQTAELHTFMSLGAQIAICDSTDKLVDYLGEVKPTVLCAVPRIFNKIHAGVRQKMVKEKPIIRKLFESGLKAASKRDSGMNLKLTEKAALYLADKLIFSKILKKFGGKMRYAISGGAALSTEVAKFINALGIAVYEGYGLSETSPIISCNFPGNCIIGSVGKPIAGVTVFLNPDDDSDKMEIVVRGPNVMRGYHNLQDETNIILSEDGWFHTGDTGYMNGGGYLFVTGRIKEQYKLENGKYVSPAPLEEELKMSPLVTNVMIYGENRPYNVALVVPNLEEIRLQAAYGGHALTNDPANDPRIMQMIQEDLDRVSVGFRGYEKIRKIAIITEDFMQENGLLTPTLKLKRSKAIRMYESILESLYSN